MNIICNASISKSDVATSRDSILRDRRREIKDACSEFLLGLSAYKIRKLLDSPKPTKVGSKGDEIRKKIIEELEFDIQEDITLKVIPILTLEEVEAERALLSTDQFKNLSQNQINSTIGNFLPPYYKIQRNVVSMIFTMVLDQIKNGKIKTMNEIQDFIEVSVPPMTNCAIKVSKILLLSQLSEEAEPSNNPEG